MNEIVEEQNKPSEKPIGWFKKFRKSSLGEILQVIVFSLIIVIPFRAYIAQPFLVSGDSMDNTFADGEYLIVDELTYHFRDPKRSEVIIFHYPLNTKKFFIKRIIGLPGETIKISDNTITICQTTNCENDSNKIVLDEPYVKKDELGIFKKDSLVTLKENEYFVLGDNRSVSLDSRIWGAVKKDLITGRPFVRLTPLSKIDFFPGQI